MSTDFRLYVLELLFRDCSGMSTRQVKEYLAKLQPQPLATPSMRERPRRRLPLPPAARLAPRAQSASPRSSSEPSTWRSR